MSRLISILYRYIEGKPLWFWKIVLDTCCYGVKIRFARQLLSCNSSHKSWIAFVKLGMLHYYSREHSENSVQEGSQKLIRSFPV